MGNRTTEFNLYKPDDNEKSWGDELRSALDTIDSALGDRLVEEEVEDAVAALLSGGDKVSLSYDDATDALTIDTSALDAEEVRDEVGSLLVGGDGITVAVDDAGDSVTISLANHASTHEKGGSDELTTFGDTTHDSVNTDESNITPWKVGYWTDSHWGNESGAAFDSSRSELKSKIDEFAADMNSWGESGADLVILGGDNANEDINSQSTSLQRHQDFYTYLSGQLSDSISIYTLAGNHEHYNSVTWGDMWWADPYPNVSTLDDTYFSIEHHHAKIICLNTGYSGDDSINSGVPAGQYDWFKNELETTEKPVFVMTHTPPHLGGNLNDYDTIGPAERGKYSNLISSYDNVVGVTFGHSHWGNGGGRFTNSLKQDYDGVPYFYQHFPFGVGDRNSQDNSVTPYGKIHIYQDGNINIEQSYAGESTGYRENFRLNGSGGNEHEAAIDELEWSYNDVPTSLDGYRPIASDSNGGKVETNTVGTENYFKISSGFDGTESLLEFHHRPTPLMYNDIDWPDMVWWVVIELNVFDAETDGWIIRGSPVTAPHIGLRIKNENIIASVADGSTTNQQYLNSDGSKRMYQVRYHADEGLARFRTMTANGQEETHVVLEDSTPPIDQTAAKPDLTTARQLYTSIKSTDSSQSANRIYDWGVSYRAPGALDFNA
jgi:hypothetical protein